MTEKKERRPVKGDLVRTHLGRGTVLRVEMCAVLVLTPSQEWSTRWFYPSEMEILTALDRLAEI